MKTKQSTVEIRKKHQGIQVGGARVTRPDVMTTEGIMHVVDRVLLPEDPEDNKRNHDGEHAEPIRDNVTGH